MLQQGRLVPEVVAILYIQLDLPGGNRLHVIRFEAAREDRMFWC